MDAFTKAMLESAGFRSGSVSELLGLDEAQEAIVEAKIHLTALLRTERKALGWSQTQLADALGTRQQVVARAETGHRSVTLDLLIRALLTLGLSLGRIGKEMEACDKQLHELREENNKVELVEIASTEPLTGLVRPERAAASARAYQVKPFLCMVPKLTEHESHPASPCGQTRESENQPVEKIQLSA